MKKPKIPQWLMLGIACIGGAGLSIWVWIEMGLIGIIPGFLAAYGFGNLVGRCTDTRREK